MKTPRRRDANTSLAFAAVLLLSSAPLAAQAPSAGDASGLVVLTIGGGPEPRMNQVAIESNVRYVDGLLPRGTLRTILFADGKSDTPSVQYAEGSGGAAVRTASAGEQAFRIIFGEAKDEGPADLKYRAPRLTAIDGPAQKASIGAAFDRLSAAPSASAPYLLYFTGHGDRNRSNLDNNAFALWKEKQGLSVRDLAAELKKLPADRPVVLVMVQCFSGAFGNLLFEGGESQGGLIDRPICGFFASTRERPAAGCTPEVNEAEYHDFTSFFFAALAGKDRLGRSVPPPDYDKDGVIGMHEAFAYAAIAEPSIDVPVATSDVFLRRYVPMKDDAEMTAIPFDQIRSQASPAQRAALDGISRALDETGPDRLKTALEEVRESMSGGGGPHGGVASGDVVAAQGVLSSWQERLVRLFPGLRGGPGRGSYTAARQRAIAYLGSRERELGEVRDASRAMARQGEERFEAELRAARCLRLLRVAKSVVLEQRLRAGGDKALIARFDVLKRLESQNPLHSARAAGIAAVSKH